MKTEIQLPAAELKTALTGLGKLVYRHATLPVLQHVRLTRKNEDGAVLLQATDLDSFATYTSTDLQPGPDVDVLIPIDAITKAVKGTKGCIAFVPEKDAVSICTFIGMTPIEETFSTLPVAEWPAVPLFTEPPVSVNESFKVSLAEALECVSRDSSRLILTGAHVDVSKPDAHYIVGTDARHLYCANSFRLDLKESLTIPARKFLLWPEFMAGGDLTLGMLKTEKTGEWVQLSSPRWRFITKAVDGNYPDWRQPLPAEDRVVTTIDLTDEALATLLQVLTRLPGADLQDEPVTFRVRDQQFYVSARGRSGTPTEVAIAGAVMGGGRDANQVCLNRQYAIKALKFGLKHIEIEDELAVVRFSNDGRQIVIMPLRPPAVAVAVAAPKSSPNPPTNEPAIPPSQPGSSNITTETERKDNVVTTATTPPERGHLKSQQNGHGAEQNALVSLADKLEALKSALRDVQTAANDALSLVRAADKEQRQKEKEIESVRASVRALQKVQI